jgi:hypothetical protein
MTNGFRVEASCLGRLAKIDHGKWRWSEFLYYEVCLNPAFDGLIAYRDGKFVIPDLDEFFAKVREEYPKRSDWTQMKKSMKASGWDWSQPDKTKKLYEFVHVCGFGDGETIDTYAKNHPTKKDVEKVRYIHVLFNCYTSERKLTRTN